MWLAHSLCLHYCSPPPAHLQVLSMLNYFRSLERTLTINCEGLSLVGGDEGAALRRKGGQLDHSHLFNTPADYV